MAPPLSLLQNRKGLDFVNDILRSNTFRAVPFFDHKKVVGYLDDISGKSIAEHVAAEPVIMIMLTSCLLGQQYKM
jgi:asparagine synthase (glutamine-hydrolysing)